jgi:predicted nucleotidyltransferase
MEKKQLESLREFADTIRDRYPGSMIFAFGSHARGSASQESDLDVCVVLPRMESKDRIAVSDIAWETGLKHDLHLSTVVISQKDFEHGPLSVSPFIQAIRSEGVAA